MSNKTSVMRGPKSVKAKSRLVTRSMTTGTALCTLPKGSRFLGVILNGAASDAGTTATLSFGTTATATELCTANVLAAGIGNGGFVGGDTTAQTVFTADQKIYAIYAETGTGSNAGDWTATILYTDGNEIAPETV